MAANNYNAGTAWNYLGTGLFDGRGAYDYSSVKQLRPHTPKASRNQGMVNPLDMLGNYFGMDKYAAYPEAAINNALSGKYLNLF